MTATCYRCTQFGRLSNKKVSVKVGMQRFLSVGECMIEFSRTADSSSWARNFAGDTLNTAWYFNCLSNEAWDTAYFTAVGSDRVSEEMCAFIASAGIDTRGIRSIAGKSPGLYTIDLDGAERSFCYWRENSAARQLAQNESALDAAFAAASEIYFSGITLAILSQSDRTRLVDALSRAADDGKQISFDPNIRPRLWDSEAEIREWVSRAGAVSTRAFPTYPDEATLFEDSDMTDTARRYRSYGVTEIVVKNGADPCLAVSGGESATVPAQLVEAPVDTTGAGDSFNAGYLAARLSGLQIAEACEYAHRLSANVVSSFGALLAPAEISRVSPRPGL